MLAVNPTNYYGNFEMHLCTLLWRRSWLKYLEESTEYVTVKYTGFESTPRVRAGGAGISVSRYFFPIQLFDHHTSVDTIWSIITVPFQCIALTGQAVWRRGWRKDQSWSYPVLAPSCELSIRDCWQYQLKGVNDLIQLTKGSNHI